jgi:putative ABC transport system permease protein
MWMKKALRKNFYMEIRHSLGRFLSIFFIVAIGCAFFSGIRASEPDMRYSGDAYFDEKNLMDIQVMSTMGLTEDDLDAIRAVDGVLDAEGSYATDVLCTIRGNQVAVHVMALQDKMNQVQLEDGRLPEKENECVIDADYLDGKNLKIGDKITLSSGTSDSLEDRYIYHCWYGQQSGVYCISQRQYNNRKWKCQCLSLRSGESIFIRCVYRDYSAG